MASNRVSFASGAESAPSGAEAENGAADAPEQSSPKTPRGLRASFYRTNSIGEDAIRAAANELIKRTADTYMRHLVRGYDEDPDAKGKFVHFSQAGLEIEPFAMKQRTLIALMDGNCPLANVLIGRTKIDVPARTALGDMNGPPITVKIESVEFDLLAFPNMMPKAEVAHICEQLLGKDKEAGKDWEASLEQQRAARREKRVRRKLKNDLRFRLLELLENWRTLLCMLVLVVAGIVTALWEVCWPDTVPWNSHDPGIFAFEVAVTVIFALELGLRAVCFAHVHGRLAPDFCRDPFVVMDMFVVGVDVAMMGITLYDMLAHTAGGSQISPGFHRVLRSCRLLKLSRMARSARVMKKLRDIQARGARRVCVCRARARARSRSDRALIAL